MKYFTTSREKKSWLLALLVYGTILSTLFIGTPLSKLLRNQDTQVILFLSGMVLIAISIGLHSFSKRPAKMELTVFFGIVAVYIMFFFRLGAPERSHLIEYSVLAICIHMAMQERIKSRTWVAGIIAFGITFFLGALDEIIQLFIPERVFDFQDIAFNGLAAALAIGSRLVLKLVSGLFICLLLLSVSCKNESDKEAAGQIPFLEESRYYYPKEYPKGEPYKQKLVYNYSNGNPYKVLKIDKNGEVFEDFTFQYDSTWNPLNKRNSDKKVASHSFETISILEGYSKFTKRNVLKKFRGDTLIGIQLTDHILEEGHPSHSGIYYPGVLSSAQWSENTFSFSENGNRIFMTRTKGWETQFPFIAKKKAGIFTSPFPFERIDSLYNGAISPSGERILYSTRVGDINSIYLLQKENGNWNMPVNLSEKSGITGGYFYWYSEEEIYFYIPDGNGDLVRGELKGGNLRIADRLESLNNPTSTEFSPFVDKDKRFIIFTRYLDGAESQQGFFVAFNKGAMSEPVWGIPVRINELSYGWNAWILKEKKLFLYTNGIDIMGASLDSLSLLK
ncbi:VanZ family protein [Robiginitalea sp. IMCC43444]|uniref:VanZ family protein n=1 Tax=Robiginitalea sp. IMCC43444 TaxID=3459121 RepID=UPI0040421304